MTDTDRLTSLVERLLVDGGLQDSLRRDPESFRREHSLSGVELDALLTGDEMRLVSLGVAPSTFVPSSSDRSWLSATLMRVAVPALAVLAALGVVAGPAAPTARAARRARFGIVVRRTGRARRVRAFPKARRALRRHDIRAGFWLRTDVRMLRFARAGAFGLYADEKDALAALQAVDPNIGKSDPGEIIVD